MVNKKSHWLQVSASKLLGYESGKIKIPTDFLNKIFKKISKTEKVTITIEFYIFELVQVPNYSLK